MQKITQKIIPFPSQGATQCGAFTVHAITNALTDTTLQNIPDYNTTWIGKTFGLTNHYTMRNMLAKQGFQTKLGRTQKLNRQQRLAFLQDNVDNGVFTVMLVGLSRGKRNQNLGFPGKLPIHWISVWGYDQDQEIFYVYDPFIKQSVHEGTPIGNATRTYDELLKQWNTIIPLLSNVYITAQK